MNYIALHFAGLRCIPFHHIALYCIVLHCIALHCNELRCIAWQKLFIEAAAADVGMGRGQVHQTSSAVIIIIINFIIITIIIIISLKNQPQSPSKSSLLPKYTIRENVCSALLEGSSPQYVQFSEEVNREIKK